MLLKGLKARIQDDDALLKQGGQMLDDLYAVFTHPELKDAILTTPTERPAHPSFWEAFRYWLKLGFISFGGPAGQISIMHQELVEKRRWISEHRFLHALNYCMVLPGPEASSSPSTSAGCCIAPGAASSPGVLFVLPLRCSFWRR